MVNFTKLLFVPQRLEMTDDNITSISSAAVSTQGQDSGESERDRGQEALNTTIR